MLCMDAPPLPSHTCVPRPSLQGDYIELCRTMFLFLEGCPDNQHPFHVMGLVANAMLKQGEGNRDQARAKERTWTLTPEHSWPLKYEQPLVYL